MDDSIIPPLLKPSPNGKARLPGSQVQHPSGHHSIQPNNPNHKRNHSIIDAMRQPPIKQQIKFHKQQEGRLRREVESGPPVDGVTDDWVQAEGDCQQVDR